MLRSGALPATRRAVAGLTAVGAASVLLAGCTVEPPTPAPEAPVVAAVVSTSQERKILDRVSGAVQAADDATDAGTLAARLTGPALAMRQAELRVAEARGDNKLLTDLTFETQQVILPLEQGWPRSSFVITVQPPDNATPALAAFEQSSAREQYKLWGFVHLAPRVTMPRFAEAELGSPAVAADDTSLKASPQAAVEQYASVLTAGEDSRYTDNFAAADDDELRLQLRKSGANQVAQIEDKDGEGSFEVAYEPAKGPVKAVRTADGGAVVLAELLSLETLKAEEGWRLTPATPSAKALWGDAEGTDVMKIAFRNTVALYVPPAGSAEQIGLLGFHRVPYAVSNG